jgi:hypothetical protein
MMRRLALATRASIPSGAKAPISSWAFSARLKSCPFTKLAPVGDCNDFPLCKSGQLGGSLNQRRKQIRLEVGDLPLQHSGHRSSPAPVSIDGLGSGVSV